MKKRRRSKDEQEQPAFQSGGWRQPRPRLQEALLVELLDELPGTRLLSNSAGRGQFAEAFARSHPDGQAVCWFDDVYTLERAKLAADRPPNLELVCGVDFPEQEFDIVGLALSKSGEAELARDLLHQGFRRLAMNGRLAASVDNPNDTWLAGELGKLFSKITRRKNRRGVAYLAVKTAEPKKVKNYEAEIVFRDGERLVHAFSLPGVFSHRKLDLGARAILETMHAPPAATILDLGCGSGALGIAAALRDDRSSILAVDSSPRAIACTEKGAHFNGVADRVRTMLSDDGADIPSASFDVALANPPYYSRSRIQEIFLQAVHRGLKPGGVLFLVTKQPGWYLDRLPGQFTNVRELPIRGYTVFVAYKGRRF